MEGSTPIDLVNLFEQRVSFFVKYNSQKKGIPEMLSERLKPKQFVEIV